MFGFELICTFCKGLGKLAVIPGIGYMKTCKHCEGTGMQSKKRRNSFHIRSFASAIL